MFRSESPVTVFRADVISAVDLTKYQYIKKYWQLCLISLYKALKAEKEFKI